jgi:ferredoxin
LDRYAPRPPYSIDPGGVATRDQVDRALTLRDSVAEISSALCKGCRACVAVCPKDAVELKGWTIEQYDAMVDAILAGDHYHARPERRPEDGAELAGAAG